MQKVDAHLREEDCEESTKDEGLWDVCVRWLLGLSILFPLALDWCLAMHRPRTAKGHRDGEGERGE